jgi:hypothetical protein
MPVSKLPWLVIGLLGCSSNDSSSRQRCQGFGVEVRAVEVSDGGTAVDLGALGGGIAANVDGARCESLLRVGEMTCLWRLRGEQ